MGDQPEPLEVLTRARTRPDIVTMPARRALALDGAGSPESDTFRRSIEALYGVAYTLKFARKRTGGEDFKVAPLEGDWTIDLTDAAARTDRDRWRWRLRIGMPADVTDDDVARAIDAATSKKTSKLFGSAEAQQVRLEDLPARRYGRILHVGPYADEPASFAVLEELLASEGLTREPGHTEVYLSDPGRTQAEKLKTALLVAVA